MHEYGGGGFCVHAGVIYFCTQLSVYRQAAPSALPEPLVAESATMIPGKPSSAIIRYAEPTFAHVSYNALRW